MTYERLIEITIELGAHYTSKRESTFKIWQIEKDAEARRFALTPQDGWPGKNEEQRRTAQSIVFDQDKTLASLIADVFETKKKLFETDDNIKVLENERRAIEWLIRSQLVQTLSLNRIDHDGGDVKDTVFDETAQATVDQATFNPDVEQMQSAYFEKAFSPSGSDQLPDDIPF